MLTVDASPLVWLLTILALGVIIVLDLLVIARRQREVTMRDATRWVCVYVALAGVFALGLFHFAGAQAGSQFVSGYLTEYSLSMDNLFVFLIIMARFHVPVLARDKVLFIGIVVSLVLRGLCIAAGAAAIASFSWVFYIFAAFLIYTGARLAFEKESEDEEFQEYAVLRLLRRVLPTSAAYDGERLTTRLEGRRLLTPLVFVVLAIGLANVVFALDSIPAIFGLTQDPYIVFAANALALMGLRQLFFLVGGLMSRIVYLNTGLAVVLCFIGVKLLIEALHGSHVDHLGALRLPELGTLASLVVIVGTLGITVVVSLARTRLGQRGEPLT